MMRRTIPVLLAVYSALVGCGSPADVTDTSRPEASSTGISDDVNELLAERSNVPKESATAPTPDSAAAATSPSAAPLAAESEASRTTSSTSDDEPDMSAPAQQQRRTPAFLDTESAAFAELQGPYTRIGVEGQVTTCAVVSGTCFSSGFGIEAPYPAGPCRDCETWVGWVKPDIEDGSLNLRLTEGIGLAAGLTDEMAPGGDIITQLSDGQHLLAFSEVRRADDQDWRRVAIPNGPTGWAAMEFLQEVSNRTSSDQMGFCRPGEYLAFGGYIHGDPIRETHAATGICASSDSPTYFHIDLRTGQELRVPTCVRDYLWIAADTDFSHLLEPSTTKDQSTLSYMSSLGRRWGSSNLSTVDATDGAELSSLMDQFPCG